MPSNDAIGSSASGGFFGVASNGAAFSTSGPDSSTETAAEAYQRGVKDGAAFQQRMDRDTPIVSEGPTPSQVSTLALEGPWGAVKAVIGAVIDSAVDDVSKPGKEDEEPRAPEEPDATVPKPDATVDGKPSDSRGDEEPKDETPANPNDPRDAGFPSPDGPTDFGRGNPRAVNSRVNFGTGASIGRDGFPTIEQGSIVKATVTSNGLVHIATVQK